ncbi:MAG: AMP-binding protein [Candidatus Omnitrophica bacterium]|nr:AMP-binding protein [Candidatus Omnitrophota bacterium]
MNFWDLSHSGKSIVVNNSETRKNYSYLEFQDRVDAFKAEMAAQNTKGKTLGFIFCRNSPAALAGYLAALQGKQAVCLLSVQLADFLRDELIRIYQPDWIWAPSEMGALPNNYDGKREWEGYRLSCISRESKGTEIHPDLAVLLSTSGTTGTPKMVRLSYRNLQANAESIAEYLRLTSNECPVTTLPMHYSYGLSVVNSHLQVGATLLLNNHDMMTRSFWNLFKEENPTSFAGVPYTFQMLHRLKFEQMQLPSLRTITQAGGHLDVQYQEYFQKACGRMNVRFFVMYGQTEATARISYIPVEKLSDCLGSIGISIPDGRMEADPETQELIYHGPNVMMGYAESRKDLNKGDELNGRLRTGDIVRQDERGHFYIQGRLKRFIKPFGLRVNLDDLESMIKKRFQKACYCTGDDSHLLIAVPHENLTQEVKNLMVDTYGMKLSTLRVSTLTDIPRLETGKVNYAALKDALLK